MATAAGEKAEAPRQRQVHLPSRLIGVSLKSYFDLHRTNTYIDALLEALTASPPGSQDTISAASTSKGGKIKSTQLGIFILPSFPALPTAASQIQSSAGARQVYLGAQNCHDANSGPFTGEVSPTVLQQVGCDIVCLGHAERRAAPFNESNEFIARKVAAAVRNGLVPLICIGETGAATKDVEQTARIHAAVRECGVQVESALTAINPLAASARHDSATSEQHRRPQVIFAYEPVWAIGAKQPASTAHICGVIKGLKTLDTVQEYVSAAMNATPSSEATGKSVWWLYGGSAGPGTWTAISADGPRSTLSSECDGLFLGRFAHDVQNLVKTVQEVEQASS